MMAAGDDAWPTRPLQGELSAGHAQVQVSQGGCLRRPSRCGQARLSPERDLAPSGLLAQASRVPAWHLLSQSGCWLCCQHRTHACGGARLQEGVQELRCSALLTGSAAPLSRVSSPVPADGPRHSALRALPCWVHVCMFPVSPKQVLLGLGWGPTCVPRARTVSSMS